MNTRALENPRTWAMLVATAVLLAVVFSAYLGAVVSPQQNTKDLPIALVNTDRGATVGGGNMNLGKQVTAKLTTPNSPLSGTVKWSRPGSRKEALEGLGNKDYYAAIVIPKDYSERLAKLSSPPGRSGAKPSGGGNGNGSAVPKPAKIEVLTNHAAGQSASSAAESIATGAVRKVSENTSGKLVAAVQKQGKPVPASLAATLGDPVQADVTDAEPVGPNSGGGNAAFFLSFLGAISGILGASLSYYAVSGPPGRSAGGPRRTEMFPAQILLGFAFSGLVAALESIVGMGFLGIEHSVNGFVVFIFLWLVIASVLAFTMLLLEVLGAAGIALSALLNFFFGLVASGGLFPLESLPGFYRAYAGVLPLRYAVDGMRSLLFYDGRADAGLGKALWVLGAYLVGTAFLGYAFSLVRERIFERREVSVPATRSSVKSREQTLALGVALEYISRRVEGGEALSPNLQRTLSNMMGPGREGASEYERAVEASEKILRPLSRLLLAGYVPGGGGPAIGVEGGEA